MRRPDLSHSVGFRWYYDSKLLPVNIELCSKMIKRSPRHQLFVGTLSNALQLWRIGPVKSPQMSPLRSFHQSELSLDALYENVRSTTPVHAVSDTNGFAFSDVLSDADSEMQACSLPEIHSREHCREKKFGMDEYEERYASSVGASYPASVEPSQDPWYPSTVQIEPDRYDPRVPNECLGCMQNPQAVYQLPSRFPQASQSFIPSYSQSYSSWCPSEYSSEVSR